MEKCEFCSPQSLLELLKQLGLVVQTRQHPPVNTVEESKAIRKTLEAGHCKNLFLKDKKGQLWVIVCDEDRAINLKVIRPKIGASHLSFGNPKLLGEVLGVLPGSVTPFAAVNDHKKQVMFVIDEDLLSHDTLYFHPLTNEMTTAIRPSELLFFLKKIHTEPLIVNLNQ